MRPNATSIAAWAVVMTSAFVAVADDNRSGPPSTEPRTPATPAYRLSAEIDGPAMVIPAVLSASWLLSPELAPPYCAPQCDPGSLNFIDKPAAGLYSAGWSNIGDVATVGVLVSMPVFLAFGERPLPAINDLVVIAEATLFASATQVLTSYATSRPRPRVYGDRAPLDQRTDGNAARSFFSGHAATCIAATVSTFRTLDYLGRPALAWTALGLGGAGSILLGIARVGAGSHFPTDVGAGALVGAAFGVLIPAVHAKTLRSEATAATGMLHYRLVPVVSDERMGGALVGAF